MFASLLATAEQLQSPAQSRASEASNISTESMPAVQLGAGDAYLIMHLWELFPALGAELSTAVHSFRKYGVTLENIEDGSWTALCGLKIAPLVVKIVKKEAQLMRRITDELEQELCC
jgi:hypothetical protein